MNFRHQKYTSIKDYLELKFLKKRLKLKALKKLQEIKDARFMQQHMLDWQRYFKEKERMLKAAKEKLKRSRLAN